MSGVAPDEFRAVIGRFATGVTVMTTLHNGEPHGMTANALSSVSLEPVLVLVCVAHSAQMSPLVRESGIFALSILAADQEAISNRFAAPERAGGTAMFEGVETSVDVTGSPVLSGALGHLDCRVWATYPGGDHDIVVGEVVGISQAEDAGAPALTYLRSAYGSAS